MGYLTSIETWGDSLTRIETWGDIVNSYWNMGVIVQLGIEIWGDS